MGKIKDFIFKSNRLKHFLLGIPCGLLANDWYAVEYCGFGVGSAMEFKDHQYGGKFDVVDILFTAAGFNIGYLLRWLFIKIL